MSDLARLVRSSRKLATLCLGAALAFPIAGGALAADVKIKDGAVWKGDVGAKVRVTFIDANGKDATVTGEITKIDASLATIRVKLDGDAAAAGKKPTEKLLFWRDIRKLESIGAAAGAAPATPGKSDTKSEGKSDGKSDTTASATRTNTTSGAGAAGGTAATLTAPDGKRMIFVMPWEGTVGIGARHEELEAIGKEADKYGPGQIIIIQVNSPGGLVTEGDKIHETMGKLSERHRVIAWIREAISAAAFTSLHCHEIYFMKVGTLGAITMFSGTVSIKGAELQAWLKMVGDVCAEHNRNRWIGEAMVNSEPLLSYDRDETTGKVTWYNTLQGKYKLSDEKQNLTFNAETAVHSKFSQGIADTVDDLLATLQIPKDSVVISDVGYKIHKDWQRTLEQCKEAKSKLMNDFQNPGGSTREAQIGNQINALKEIIKWYKKCYPGMVYEAPNMPPDVKMLEEELDRLKKELANSKNRGG